MSEEQDKQREQDVVDRQRVERSDPENVQGRQPQKVDMSDDAYRERLQCEREGVATDEDRRLIRLHRKLRSEEYDRRADAERADQEKENGEAEGARGRNASTAVIVGEDGPETVRDAQGGVTSAGRSTPASSEPATQNDENSKQDHPSSARTTGRSFSSPRQGSSGAPSTGGSGTANQ